jgi:hypothetical protein
VLILCAVGAGAEIALRFWRPEFLRDAPVEALHIYSQAYGWKHRPNWKGQLSDGPPITVNAAGRRGLEAKSHGRPGTTRVLLLGDSIVFGAGVADHQTFAHRLQEDGPGFAVFNLGVSGYGTDQALLRLMREGFELEPDVVVLNLCLANDYLDNALDVYLYDGRTPKPYFVVQDDELRLQDAHMERPWHESAGLFLRDRSYLFGALTKAVGSGITPAAPASDHRPEHWRSRKDRILKQEFPRATDVTLRLIARMAELCRRREVRFLVLAHPDRQSFEGDDTLLLALQHPRLQATEVVDLRAQYRSAGLSYALVGLDKVGHLRPLAHAFVAQVLRVVLETRVASS